MAGPLLDLADVHTFYGNVHALQGISLHVDEGEIVTLVGGNGAGKSTTLNTISGLVRPRSGTVRLGDDDLARYEAHQITARGVVQVPEGRRVFARLTVLENLRMGAFIIRDQAVVREGIDSVFALFPRLEQRRDQVAGTLSGGEQQMLAIGRALMARPRVILLDEPSLGLAPILVEQIFATISEINAQGVTVLLVEQNALQALSIASRGYVLQSGRVVLAGTSAELLGNEMVRKAYLGES
ncbi:MAG: ABC transporter ATP-binding protein [Chloroflexi bacterium]|jgi:branched-chain amino acid transport system ATP-binding protein|nr:ABC transporter ATP-binding protein [Chloroflexota bacterium]